MGDFRNNKTEMKVHGDRYTDNMNRQTKNQAG